MLNVFVFDAMNRNSLYKLIKILLGIRGFSSINLKSIRSWKNKVKLFSFGKRGFVTYGLLISSYDGFLAHGNMRGFIEDASES